MWFEWLFKYPREVYERGELAFAAPLSAWWWLAAALLLALGFVFARRLRGVAIPRRVVIHTLQLAAVALVLALVAQPILEVARLKDAVNTVAVLLDTSESMALPADANGAGQTRLDVAKRLIESEVAVATGDARMALFRFDSRLERLPETLPPDAPLATGERSRLVDSLTDLVTNQHSGALAAVVVLTDGAQNGGDAVALDDLAAAGVPVHTVGIGAAAMAGDVELTQLSLPRRAAPDTQVTARLVVRHSDGGEVRARVLDGESVLAVKTLDLDRTTPVVTVDIPFPSGATGLKDLTVELADARNDPLPGNNARSGLLEVTRDKHRVLYLEGEPRWEFKFIRRALAEDDDIALVTWLRTTPRKTYRQGVANANELADGFPATREALYAFDLIVLGSLPATAFGDAEHGLLQDFVAERGGSLLALAGRNALAAGGWDVKPLARALPVTLRRAAADAPPAYAMREYGVAATEEGLATALTNIGADRQASWATLPMLADYHRVGEVKPGATTYLEALRASSPGRGSLAERDGGRSPLLIAQPFGFGHTAVLATASTWRWRMRTPPEDTRHSLFWRQLVRHFASAAQPRQHFVVDSDGDALAIRLSLRDAQYQPITDVEASALVTSPNGEGFATPLRRLDDGAYAATLAADAPGIYRLDAMAEAPGKLGTMAPTTRFARVGTPGLEQFDAGLNEALLSRIAAATGGGTWRPDALGGLASAIAFGDAGIREREALPLWNAPFLFVLVVLLKCAEWSLRRYWGAI